MQLTRMWKAVLMCICAVALSFTCAMTAGAAEVDFSRTGTINVSLMRADESHTPVPYGVISIYQVADVVIEDHQLILRKNENFADSGVSLSDLNAEGIAQHLLTWAQTQELTGETKTAGADGSVKFENLELGLYLVAQEGFAQDDSQNYPIEPFLVVLPMASEDGTGWDYEITAHPKTEEIPQTPSNTSRSVRKVWEGDNEYLRPATVSVSLLRNGQVYETVTLDTENQWEYSWTGLSTDYTWTISENEVPEDYTASYSVEDTLYTITNTYADDSPDAPYPNPEGEDDGDGNEDGSTDGGDDEEKLPQTGQLRWPIPILAAAGVILFAIGWCVNVSGKRDKHA